MDDKKELKEMEYSETFKKDRTEIEIKMKIDCHTG